MNISKFNCDGFRETYCYQPSASQQIEIVRLKNTIRERFANLSVMDQSIRLEVRKGRKHMREMVVLITRKGGIAVDYYENDEASVYYAVDVVNTLAPETLFKIKCFLKGRKTYGQ